MTFKYKTKDGQDFVIPNVGETVEGIIESEIELESPNLELVTVDEVANTPPVVEPVAPVPEPIVAELPVTPVEAPVFQIQPPVQSVVPETQPITPAEGTN